MIAINSENRMNGRDIYFFVQVKTPFYNWLKRCIDYADLQEGKDFVSVLKESSGGRPGKDIYFTIDAAKEMCIVSATKKAKELRRWLIGLSKQRENLELITVKEAAFAARVVNCLRFINSQKDAYSFHQSTFIEENNGKISPKYIYAEFAKYRAKIVGWDKTKTDAAITEYLKAHVGYNKSKLMASSMQTKISVLDIGEAIRIAVMDILYAQHENKDLINKFSLLCKNLAKEMEIQPEKENTQTLFRQKEQIDSVKSISLKSLKQ